jgi:uncharacterized repeat protein (TIGR01451 family)
MKGVQRGLGRSKAALSIAGFVMALTVAAGAAANAGAPGGLGWKSQTAVSTDLRKATALAALTQIPVLATRLDEASPAGDGDWLVWSQNSSAHPRHYNTYARQGSGPRFRVNAPNTIGWGGGLDGSLLAYQQLYKGQSSIKLYDLANRVRSNPPAGVNTRQWEYWPRISGEWLLFGRASASLNRVVLHNLASGEEIILARGRIDSTYLTPGQVNSHYAVWTKCVTRCDVFLFDLQSRTITRVPNPLGKEQYSVSIDAADKVYYARGGRACGASTKLMRWDSGSAATSGPVKLLALPTGQDFEPSYAVSNADGSTTVLYNRVRCPWSRPFDIYEVTDPSTDLSVTQALTSPEVAAPASVPLTISVVNNGPGIATGVTVTDTLPPGVVVLDPPSGWTCDPGDVLTCVLPGSLGPGASAGFTLDAVATCAATAATQPVHNVATVTSSLADTNSDNSTADLAMTVTASSACS